MPVTATPVFPQLPKTGKVQILPADTQGQKAGFTPGANGSKVTAIIVTSTDTAARDIQISINNGGSLSAGTVTGGTFYPIGTKTVAITAGTIAATPAANLLDPTNIVGLPVDNDGNPYLLLLSTDFLCFESLVTVTTAKAINITVIYADF